MSINRVLITLPFETDDEIISGLKKYMRSFNQNVLMTSENIQVNISKHKTPNQDIEYAVWTEKDGLCFEKTFNDLCDIKFDTNFDALDSIQLYFILQQIVAFGSGYHLRDTLEENKNEY